MALSDREQKMLDDLGEDFFSGRLDGVVRSDPFFAEDAEFNREFNKTWKWARRAWLGALILGLLFIAGMVGLALLLLGYFGVI